MIFLSAAGDPCSKKDDNGAFLAVFVVVMLFFDPFSK